MKRPMGLMALALILVAPFMRAEAYEDTQFVYGGTYEDSQFKEDGISITSSEEIFTFLVENPQTQAGVLAYSLATGSSQQVVEIKVTGDCTSKVIQKTRQRKKQKRVDIATGEGPGFSQFVDCK